MFKPMLAGVGNLEDLTYPVFISPKLDGIRAIVVNGELVSRTMKPIPNAYTLERFSHSRLEGIDGELIIGDPTAPDCFNKTTSGVMKTTGWPDAKFYVFDQVGESNFRQRIENLPVEPHVVRVPQLLVWTQEQAAVEHAGNLFKGYEGSMIRSPAGPYKQGRSTTKEGYLLKIKPFVDDEAVITGFKELLHNLNPAEQDAFARTKRSSRKDNMVPAGVLGALEVRNAAGQEFSIGTGFSAAERASIWAEQKTWLGLTIRYRYQAEGMKDVPRFPVFAGQRCD